VHGWRGQTQSVALVLGEDGILRSDTVFLRGFVPMTGQDRERSTALDSVTSSSHGVLGMATRTGACDGEVGPPLVLIRSAAVQDTGDGPGRRLLVVWAPCHHSAAAKACWTWRRTVSMPVISRSWSIAIPA
jgi:hypothetical protein